MRAIGDGCPCCLDVVSCSFIAKSEQEICSFGAKTRGVEKEICRIGIFFVSLLAICDPVDLKKTNILTKHAI